MKIAVLAANGKAGKKIVAEAADRGIEVTAFVCRAVEVAGASKVVVKDIFSLTTDDLKDFDAVVDAFGAWTSETLPLHSTTLKHLCDILSGSQVRLLIVGGAGSLYIDADKKTQLKDTQDFPDEYKPLATAQAKSLDELRSRNDVKWTYVSPAADFQAEGERNAKYMLSGEIFTTNEAGESIISYADYAIAMVDEIAHGDNIQKRISVLNP